ncbi:MAG: hypothetical protein VX278_13165 [Myxococcota bacterium]|nr:hypothetical protein [Myxococcota bacterium]
MKFAIVQYVPSSGNAHYFVSDIIRLFHFSLLDLGYSCILLHNRVQKDRINILFSWVHLSPQSIDELVSSQIPYILFQPEILSKDGLNDTEKRDWQKRWPPIWKLFSHATRIWELFDFNLSIGKKYNPNIDLIPLGYHPKMESNLPAKPTRDAIFFGSSSSYRRGFFKSICQQGIDLNCINFAPSLFRNDELRRSRCSLNIPLNETNMFHVSPNRVTAGLYHSVPTVSPSCRCSSWLRPMIRILDSENFADALQTYLKKALYEEDIHSFRSHFIANPMTKELEKVLKKI